MNDGNGIRDGITVELIKGEPTPEPMEVIVELDDDVSDDYVSVGLDFFLHLMQVHRSNSCTDCNYDKLTYGE